MKIKEHLRPPKLQLRNKLLDKISPLWEELFIFDIQNDCDCDIEKYDNDVSGTVVTLDLNVIQHNHYITLQMLPNINNQMLIEMVIKAQQLRLTLPRLSKWDYEDKLWRTSNNLYNFLKNNSIIMPFKNDPEYTGVITMNLLGFNAFIKCDTMFKPILDL